MDETPVFWQRREWTGEQWYQYQKDLKRSDIDTQIEQAKEYFIDKAKKYPPTVTILGKTINPRE